MNMISAINNQGKLLFMFYEKAMNAELFQRFMEQLIKEYHGKKKVYLIVDNLRVHHALCLLDWLKENENELELRYLPSYSPELNPDEYVNNDLKQALNKGEPARGKEKLREQVETHMNRRANEPEVMKKLFRHKRIQYAGRIVVNGALSVRTCESCNSSFWEIRPIHGRRQRCCRDVVPELSAGFPFRN